MRDLSFDSRGELSRIKQLLSEKSQLRNAKYGRFNVISVSAKDFFSTAEELLDANPYALTQYGLDVN